ncbi:MAG: hypothetical protein AB9866_18320 [Syntrophobacteraceae bacterium]
MEAVLNQTRQDLLQAKQPLSDSARKSQMALAAETLYEDYKSDQELTGFMSLDFEDLHGIEVKSGS